MATSNDQFGEFLMTKLGNLVDHTVHFYLAKDTIRLARAPWRFWIQITRCPPGRVTVTAHAGYRLPRDPVRSGDQASSSK